MSNIEVKKEFICLPQYPAPTDCTGFTCSDMCPPCHCLAGACLIPAYIVSNADFEITVADGGGIFIIPRPSEFLQYAIVSESCPGQIEVKFFRFLCIENENKDRFLVQSRNEEGKLECRELFFADKDKCKNNCR